MTFVSGEPENIRRGIVIHAARVLLKGESTLVDTVVLRVESEKAYQNYLKEEIKVAVGDFPD